MATDKFGRIMMFIDGTNLLLEASKEIGVEFRAEKPPEAALHMAKFLVKMPVTSADMVRRDRGILVRRYWFGSYQGNEEYDTKLRTILRDRGFEPVLFKKKEGKEKGVDIALTREMLVNAFNQNFNTGILVAGDEDYVGLVKEVKRYGPTVHGAFFTNHGLSTNLRLSFDAFYSLNLPKNLRDSFAREVEDEMKKAT